MTTRRVLILDLMNTNLTVTQPTATTTWVVTDLERLPPVSGANNAINDRGLLWNTPNQQKSIHANESDNAF